MLNSYNSACSQGNLGFDPEQIATKNIPVPICRKFCVDSENIKLPQIPALDQTHFWASLKEGFKQKIIEIYGMWIKKMFIFLLFASRCWLKKYHYFHTEQQYVDNTLIYIHSVKQKTDLHNSEMAATLCSDRNFGILNKMLCGILIMNTRVKACLYFSN